MTCSLCLAGRVRGERSGLKVTVRRELTAGLSLYAWSSPLTDFPLSWPFGQGFYKLPTHPSRGSSASDFQSRSVRSLELLGGGEGGRTFRERPFLKTTCCVFFLLLRAKLSAPWSYDSLVFSQVKGINIWDLFSLCLAGRVRGERSGLKAPGLARIMARDTCIATKGWCWRWFLAPGSGSH